MQRECSVRVKRVCVHGTTKGGRVAEYGGRAGSILSCTWCRHSFPGFWESCGAQDMCATTSRAWLLSTQPLLLLPGEHIVSPSHSWQDELYASNSSASLKFNGAVIEEQLREAQERVQAPSSPKSLTCDTSEITHVKSTAHSGIPMYINHKHVVVTHSGHLVTC